MTTTAEADEMPPCLGGYEVDDATCNGDPKGEGDELIPCAFRDRCVAFIKLCEIKELPRDKLIKIRKRKSDGEEVSVPKIQADKFHGAIDSVISKFGIKDGRLSSVAGKKKTTKSTKVPPKDKATTIEAKELASWFNATLQERCGRSVHPVPGDASPGALYVVDRLDKSNYAAMYAKGQKGRIAVASVYPNNRGGSLQVRIAADFNAYINALSKDDRERLNPIDHTGKDGAFKVRLLNLDKELAALAAETVASAIKHGIIALPDV